MKTNKLLSLGGYLEMVADDFMKSFTRVFPATDALPEVKVGIGPFTFTQYYSYRAVVVPESLHPEEIHLGEEGVTDVAFSAAIEGRLHELSHLPNWQEHLLFNFGYTYKVVDGRNWWNETGCNWWSNLASNELYTLLNLIPVEERDFLLTKHGFHKVAVMASHGHVKNVNQLITAIDGLDTGLSYSLILGLLDRGVPLEDVPLASKLPDEMVAGLYGNGSSLEVGVR